jgi:mono/diheme cytochrome c family protein
MSETLTPVESAPEPRVVGILGQFPDGHALVEATEKTRKAGYTKLDAYTPIPVHGLDEAMGLKPVTLPWFVFCGGLTGTATAVALQYFTNAFDYPFKISGKPLFSIPASVPVGFELTVLFSAFSAFFGMLIFNRLWNFYHPVVESKLYSGVTDNRFLLAVQATDPMFNVGTTTDMMRSLGATAVETVSADASPVKVPRPIYWGLVTLGLVLLIPPLMIIQARAQKFDWYPFRLELGMRNQAKFKPQVVNPLFMDNRADRRPVAGTIAQGELQRDEHLYDGLVNGQLATTFPEVDKLLSPDQLKPDMDLEKKFTLVMNRGQQRFNIYCASCHGFAGLGNGTTAQRAEALQRTGEEMVWVQPAAFAEPKSPVREQPIGQIFQTITNGVRSMKGYGYRVSPEDRWAIVLYVKALQKAQVAKPDDIPDGKLEKPVAAGPKAPKE